MPCQKGGAIDKQVLAESHTSARPRALGWWWWIGLMAQPVSRVRRSQTRAGDGPCQWGGPAGEDDEGSIRLLLEALVSRLKQQPQELAERTVRQGSEAPDREGSLTSNHPARPGRPNRKSG